MKQLTRRNFGEASLAACAGWSLVPGSLRADQAAVEPGKLRLASFRFDVTPPTGHSLCGGWIRPVVDVDDPLEAIGLVLLGAGKPIVICAVDWTGLLNSAHLRWREAIAKAAGTTPDRVAVHCVHQHNAPFACLDAQRIVAEQGDLPDIVSPEFFDVCLERAQRAVSESLSQARRVTHIATAETPVVEVAANRRVSRNADGSVKAMRGSSSRDEYLRGLPEGLIDPAAKTIAFYDQSRRIAACHYYAVHPMSYYGDGRVSSDFAGLARKRLQAADAECTQLYFTGCAGNVAAGKYNDGSVPMREVLTGRVHDALSASLERLSPIPIGSVAWKSVDVLPLPNPALSAEKLAAQIGNRDEAVVNRNRPSYQLAWLRRIESRLPITISALRIDATAMLHLPAECFIEYQLAAQRIARDTFLATAAYGDGGPWYVPTAAEYPHGGYEVSVAFSDASIDPTLRDAIRAVVGDA